MSIGIEFRISNPEIGLVTRTPRPGPELDVMKHEVPALIGFFARRGLEIAVFWEPKVDVGFPDLVLAVFSPSVFVGWSETRSTLTTTDLKIVHELFCSGGTSLISLEKRLGYSNRQLRRSIDKLGTSRMIHRSDSQWQLRSLHELFGIRNLIAIEVKLNKWGEAFAQAKSNTWFASESYIFSPIRKPRPSTQDRSAEHKVGILTRGSDVVQKVVSARPAGIPASYASWQFNEWIGRALNR